MTKTERKQIIQIAKDLGYSKDTLNKLENAKTEIEMDNIMISERRRKE